MPTHLLHHRRPLVKAIALMALVTAGAACSSSGSSESKPAGGSTPSTAVSGTGAVSASDADTSGAGPNPCTIVTAAEVQAIAGAAATNAGPTSKNRGHQCTWNATNGGSVLVQVFQGKEFYDPSMQAPSAKKLTGLGDDAYLDDFGTTRVAVGFLKGDTAVFIDGFQSPGGSDAVVAAAKTAAANV